MNVSIEFLELLDTCWCNKYHIYTSFYAHIILKALCYINSFLCSSEKILLFKSNKKRFHEPYPLCYNIIFLKIKP